MYTMKETLQVGYIAEEFDRIEGRKTAVDADPKKLERFYYPKNQGGGYKHHIFHESFISFAQYIPNKYDIIHFTKGATDYELKLAKKLLNKGGEIIC
jgi:hypothetical protein